MHFWTAALSALLVFGTGDGALAQACPALAPEVRSFGSPTADLTPSDVAYSPRGLRMLGQPIPYVVVTYADDEVGPNRPIDAVTYRLGNLQRSSGEPYPRSVTSQFERFYPDTCDGRECSFDSDVTRAGALWGAALTRDEPYYFISTDGGGPVLEMIRADKDADAFPALLVCSYAY